MAAAASAARNAGALIVIGSALTAAIWGAGVWTLRLPPPRPGAAAPSLRPAPSPPARGALPHPIHEAFARSCDETLIVAAVLAADLYRESASGSRAVPGITYRQLNASAAVAEELYIARCLQWLGQAR